MADSSDRSEQGTSNRRPLTERFIDIAETSTRMPPSPTAILVELRELATEAPGTANQETTRQAIQREVQQEVDQARADRL